MKPRTEPTTSFGTEIATAGLAGAQFLDNMAGKVVLPLAMLSAAGKVLKSAGSSTSYGTAPST